MWRTFCGRMFEQQSVGFIAEMLLRLEVARIG